MGSSEKGIPWAPGRSYSPFATHYSRPNSLEFAVRSWSHTARPVAICPARSNPAEVTDGPQVFRSLPVGALLGARHLGAQSGRLFGDRGRGLDPDRALRLPGNEAGDRDLLRRAGACRPVDPDRARRLCRDL